jgi:hypothetical protein
MHTQNQKASLVNKSYLIIVILLMCILPAIAVITEFYLNRPQSLSMILIGKWFLFWAVGIRLFTAGCKQVINPSFTSKTIFHIENKESFIIVKELGFANICIGSIAIISLFLPGWRMAAAFSGGLFLGIAGINHLIKKPAGLNERVAMVSDLFIGIILLLFIISTSRA